MFTGALSSSHRSMMITWSLVARNLSHIRDRGSSCRKVISDPLPLRKLSPTRLSISCFAPISRHASTSKSSSLPSFSIEKSEDGLIAKNRMSGKPDFRKRELSSSSLWAQLIKKRKKRKRKREGKNLVNPSFSTAAPRSSRAYMTACRKLYCQAGSRKASTLT